MKDQRNRAVGDLRGSSAIEYGLIATGIAVAIVVLALELLA